VLGRRGVAIDRERVERFSRYEREANGRPVELDLVLDAYLAPIFRIAHEDPGGALFARLLGRLSAEDDLPRVVREAFGLVLDAFTFALSRALPDLPEEDLIWRTRFAIGALAYTVREGWRLDNPGRGSNSPADWCTTLQRLMDFLKASFEAPVTRKHDSVYAVER
jgi:Tetracyclin repressor-like, C-terminal domain